MELSSALIGQRIGNYRVTKLLAAGGMGAVYVAEHPAIGRRVAVKVLLPEVASHEEMVRRFFNEARAAHSIRHPGIVEILDFGTLPDGASYIVMELLEGENLATRLRHVERLGIEAAIDFTIQAAQALGAAHEQNVVHRDLKPDNLFLVADARRPGHEMIKVLDFGIAKLLPGPGGAGSFRTRTGVTMGTPIYMSPEQCFGTKEVDSRTDIYALGLILFQMLVGAPPFMSEGYGELMNMHISVTPPRLRSRDPRIPEYLDDAVGRALAKDPAHRPQTMKELIQRLEGRGTAAWPVAAAVQVGGGAPIRAEASPATPRANDQVRSTTTLESPSFTDREISKLRRRRWTAPVGAAGVLVASAVIAVLALKPWSTAAPPAAKAAPPAAAVVPAAADIPPPAPLPNAPARITVSVTSFPSGAQLVRDRDQAVIGATPFKESWPAGTGTERLHVEQRGYKPESIVVPLDRGAELNFRLARQPKPARPAGKRPGRAPQRAAPRAEPVPL